MSAIVIRKNAIKPVGFTVKDNWTEGATITVASATFQVNDTDGVAVQASSSATITNNGTALVRISGNVDTTASGFVDGSSYEAVFTYTVGSVTDKVKIDIKIGETSL